MQCKETTEDSGAYPAFSKGGGEERARSTSFEPNAACGKQQAKGAAVGPGAQPTENFVLSYALNQ